MRTEIINGPVLALDDLHPAKRFLEAFLDCKANCVGRHHGLDGQAPIDQSWTSSTDGRVWTFSGFAYAFLSLDILLDGLLQNAPNLTPSEIAAARKVPVLRTAIEECVEAANYSGNSQILELTDQVLEMLNLWEEYLDFRKEMVSRAGG